VKWMTYKRQADTVLDSTSLVRSQHYEVKSTGKLDDNILYLINRSQLVHQEL
jgi:hypothetical protein